MHALGIGSRDRSVEELTPLHVLLLIDDVLGGPCEINGCASSGPPRMLLQQQQVYVFFPREDEFGGSDNEGAKGAKALRRPSLQLSELNSSRRTTRLAAIISKMSIEQHEGALRLGRRVGLLDLPLDILLLIFDECMSGSESSPLCGCFGKAYQQDQAKAVCRQFNLELVNSALRKAVKHHFANRRWRIVIKGFDAVVQTDVPCPRFWCSTPPRRLDVRFHGFYNLSALPTTFWTLSTLCNVLRKFEPLRSLRIYIDVALPRPNAPFNIDLIELDRAPLEVLILLQPFRILQHISDARIDVCVGSTGRPLLQDTPIVSEEIASVKEHLMDKEVFASHNRGFLLELERKLGSQEDFWRLWKDPAASCADFGRESRES